MDIENRLKNLRIAMKNENINTYIITKFDPHQSEDAALYFNGVVFISGFTGSNGTVVVTQNQAHLWTDGRYYVQATQQLLNSSIILERESDPTTKDFMTFAKDVTPKNGTIGFDGRTLNAVQAKQFCLKIAPKSIELKTDIDLINDFWENRPALSKNKIFNHELVYCGKSRAEKLAEVRKIMTDENADVYILSSLDDIAWLFNLRGNDVEHNTTFASFAVIDKDNAALFLDLEKANNVKELLLSEKIILDDYKNITNYLSTYSTDKIFILNPTKTNYSLYKKINNYKIEISVDITTNLKSIKNATEIENIKNSTIRDCAYVVKFIKWLKDSVGKTEINECDISDKLIELRSKDSRYISTSFQTIAAYMENGAMMHYHANKENCSPILPTGFLLVDSGAQYFDGTTDITRTISLGNLTEQMKRDFTLVLKSHIALARATFLFGCTGGHLDVLARTPMWENLMDYKCGTGHGLGYCLNVHEGPQSISQRTIDTKLQIGMLITNEPGVYRQSQYGIRTENTILVEPYSETEFGKFLRFYTVSFCPIDLEAVDTSMLNNIEKDWLNNYHESVFSKLAPLLNEDEKDWLKINTRNI